MTDEEIEALAVQHEAFGFGAAGGKSPSTHGFDPEGLISFARAIQAAEREACEKACEGTWRETLIGGDRASWNAAVSSCVYAIRERSNAEVRDSDSCSPRP